MNHLDPRPRQRWSITDVEQYADSLPNSRHTAFGSCDKRRGLSARSLKNRKYAHDFSAPRSDKVVKAGNGRQQ